MTIVLFRLAAIEKGDKAMASEIGMVEKLKGYFESREDIYFAFLFGSHVMGKTFRESDIDVAIYFKDGYSFNSIKKIWGELEEILGKDLDLVVLNTAPPLIGYTAIRGKSIAINDYRVYLDYMLSVSQESEDFREFVMDMWRLRERFRVRSLKK
ncbi:MAG: nucleotidyltransferase domain-containing protein [Thermodesulfobacteriota bacterium]